LREETVQGINTNPDPKELRNFSLITGSLIPVIFGLLLPWIFDRSFPVWPWPVGGVLVFIGLVLPMALKPVYLVWMTIGHYLGWINSRIILSIMFYCIILPVGWFRRLLGKDSMARSMKEQVSSYRVLSSNPDKKHVERPF